MVLVLCNIPNTQQLSALEENKQNEVSKLFVQYVPTLIHLPPFVLAVPQPQLFLSSTVKNMTHFSHNRLGEK